MSADFREVELFGWIGEDELGSGVIGLKQALVPAGVIAMVATTREKMSQQYIVLQLRMQATTHAKTIRLCRYRFVEELITLSPDGRIERRES